MHVGTGGLVALPVSSSSSQIDVVTSTVRVSVTNDDGQGVSSPSPSVVDVAWLVGGKLPFPLVVVVLASGSSSVHGSDATEEARVLVLVSGSSSVHGSVSDAVVVVAGGCEPQLVVVVVQGSSGSSLEETLVVVVVVHGSSDSSLEDAVVVVVVAEPHTVVGDALTQLHSAPTDLTTLSASPKPHAPTTQLRAVAWMAADESQRQPKSSLPQPTTLAAEVMQAVAQPGTAEMEAAQGCGQSGAEVMVEVEVVVVVGGSGASVVVVVVVVVGGSGVSEVLVEVVASQEVAGDALTQLQSAPTDLTTWRASPKPQAPTTQFNAVAWMAADESQRQPKSLLPHPTTLAADVIHAVAHAGTAEIDGAQGCGHSGASVIVEVARVVVVVGGSSGILVVVVMITSTVLVEVEVAQGVVGLAVTQEHMLPTAVMTLGASIWQPFTTHMMAVSWIASELAHWQA